MGLKPSQKMAVYSHDAHDTLAPVGLSCQGSNYCSPQGSQLSETDDHFQPLVAYRAPFSTTKEPMGIKLPGLYQLDLPVS